MIPAGHPNMKGSDMAEPWFRPIGWLYRPTTWQGFGLSSGVALFCDQAFVAVDSHSHSASDTLWGLFPYVGPAFLLFNWIAARKSSA